MQKKSFYLAMALLAIVLVTATTILATETWRGPLFVKYPSSIELGADQSLLAFGGSIKDEPQQVDIWINCYTSPGDSVRFLLANQKPIFASGHVEADSFRVDFLFSPDQINPGIHMLKDQIDVVGKRIKFELVTQPMVFEFGQACPIFVTEIAIKKVGDSKWQAIDGFVPPDTPYAEGSQLTAVTGDFAEALGEVHGTIRSDRTETRVFYSFDGNKFPHGTKILLVSHLNSGIGTVQWAEGGDWSLELKVDWYGNFNWGDRSDLRAYIVAKATGVATANSTQPVEFALNQNYPNPFNPQTTISYDLAEPAQVTLTVYTVTGTEVARLVDSEQTGGHYSVEFDGQNLTSGTYIYVLKAGGRIQSRRMQLVK